ncbi:MAG: CRISPR-associated protein Cas5 [Micromonosporaceae bacterium]|nr:CRISPR-associated protein Cas5 [Micromonosporaceae bacterium]
MTSASSASAPSTSASSAGCSGVDAVRVELFAPIASFRDPMVPGLTRCLPVPPPSCLRGMLAAASGAPAEAVALGYSAWAAGSGVDAQTYHPIASNGSNPSIRGRVRAIKGGMTLRDRPFLAHLTVTLWIPMPDGERLASALRRPVWGLRLGRSEDLVHVRSTTQVRLHPAEEAHVGHALAPVGGHRAGTAITVRMAERISSDRLVTTYGNYLWSAEPIGRVPVVGALRDGDQAVWLDHPPQQPR